MNETFEVGIVQKNFRYKLILFDKVNMNCFKARLKTNVFTKSEAERWLKDFEEKTFNNYRVQKTFPSDGTKLIFKKSYRCHHNTRVSYPSRQVKNPHEKNTNCPATLMLTIKNSNMKRSKDLDLKNLPTEIFINYIHNHPVQCADALRHRMPADGSTCPNLQWCYHLYYSIFKKKYGATDGNRLIESLNQFIDKYNETCGSISAVLNNTSTGLIVVLCSPLMRRIHANVQQCSEIMFVDSSGTMDRHNTRVFLFLTPSIAGALPVGVILTYSESEHVLKDALLMWKSILPNNSFYGKHTPNLIITDDSKSERNALREVFPESTLLLCKFHVLQEFWRYVWDSSNGVPKAEHPEIFNMFKKVVNASDKTNTENIFDSVLKDPLIAKHVRVQTHLVNMRTRVSEWSLSFRNDLLTRGHNTNNYAEATFRVLKDIILCRTKAYNIVHLFDFLVTRFESYFERRIIDVVNNRTYNYQHSRYYIADSKIKLLKSTRTIHGTFDVFNAENKSTYNVDIVLGICSCPIGMQGELCKHQYAVCKEFKKSTQLFFLVYDRKAKEMLLRLVSLDFKCSNEWFLNLKSEEEYVENDPSINPPLTSSSASSVTLPSSSSDVQDVNNLPLTSNVTDDDETKDITLCTENLKKCFSDIIQRLQSKPDVYLTAYRKFVKKFENLKTESSIISSLHSFGKGNIPYNKRKNISVQPTAIARRKTYVGGRKVQQTGRPAKRSIPEHNYATVQQCSWAEIPQRIMKKAPHCLSLLAQENIHPARH